MNEYVYRIDPQPQYFEDLNRKLNRWKYPVENEAINALDKACVELSLEFKRETKNKCPVFLNTKDGGEIARVVSERGPAWSKQGQAT